MVVLDDRTGPGNCSWLVMRRKMKAVHPLETDTARRGYSDSGSCPDVWKMVVTCNFADLLILGRTAVVRSLGLVGDQDDTENV